MPHNCQKCSLKTWKMLANRKTKTKTKTNYVKNGLVGICKTKLVEEFKLVAQSKASTIQILGINCRLVVEKYEF